MRPASASAMPSLTAAMKRACSVIFVRIRSRGLDGLLPSYRRRGRAACYLYAGVIEIPLPLMSKLARQGAEIVRAQTTFADVRVDDGVFRIEYEGKQEASLVPGRVSALRFESEHELLIDYREPWLDLLLSSAPDAVAEAEHDLVAAVDEIFHGWRKLRRYANKVLADVLRDGFGLALRGPGMLALRAEHILARHGARTQLRPWPGRAAEEGFSALVADRSFVVAKAFRATSDAPVGA